jgi:hypothetical protein
VQAVRVGGPDHPGYLMCRENAMKYNVFAHVNPNLSASGEWLQISVILVTRNRTWYDCEVGGSKKRWATSLIHAF